MNLNAEKVHKFRLPIIYISLYYTVCRKKSRRIYSFFSKHKQWTWKYSLILKSYEKLFSSSKWHSKNKSPLRDFSDQKMTFLRAFCLNILSFSFMLCFKKAKSKIRYQIKVCKTAEDNVFHSQKFKTPGWFPTKQLPKLIHFKWWHWLEERDRPEAVWQYATWTGSFKLLWKHSLNGDGLDSLLENLSPLCRSCTGQKLLWTIVAVWDRHFKLGYVSIPSVFRFSAILEHRYMKLKDTMGMLHSYCLVTFVQTFVNSPCSLEISRMILSMLFHDFQATNWNRRPVKLESKCTVLCWKDHVLPRWFSRSPRWFVAIRICTTLLSQQKSSPRKTEGCNFNILEWIHRFPISTSNLQIASEDFLLRASAPELLGNCFLSLLSKENCLVYEIICHEC